MRSAGLRPSVTGRRQNDASDCRLCSGAARFGTFVANPAERRAAGQEEVLGVLGQGVQQMRSEQARHASELNDNLRAEQRRWRQCISDAQAQQGDQQQHIEALEARLDTAVEALSLEYKNLCAALPKILPAVSNTPKSAVTQGASSQTQPKVSSQPRLEHQIRVEQIRSEPDLRSQTHHPNPEILMRLEALEGRYREPRSQGQASLPNSPRTRVALAEAERVSTPQAVTQPAEALTTTRTTSCSLDDSGMIWGHFPCGPEVCSGAMAEEDEYVAGTIATIGSLITKPKMTEKYLKKPPFRFLHDIVMEVTKKTTFGQGLFTPEECDSGNLSDKQAKLDFLNKAISVTCFALGESIDVSANKIVAGLEPEKTNAWLQRLHAAATTCAGEKSDAAVARVQSGEMVGAAKEKKKKPKEDAPPPPPEGGDEDEAKKEEERKKRAERKKREEEKKRKEAEDAAAANEPPAPPAPSVDEEEERRKEEKRQKDEERRRRKEEEKRLQDPWPIDDIDQI
eukprot:s2598_g2.t1